MADKISMSQRALPKVSQRYIPHNATFKNDRNGLHFMTGASLRLGPGNNFLAHFTNSVTRKDFSQSFTEFSQQFIYEPFYSFQK